MLNDSWRAQPKSRPQVCELLRVLRYGDYGHSVPLLAWVLTSNIIGCIRNLLVTAHLQLSSGPGPVGSSSKALMRDGNNHLDTSPFRVPTTGVITFLLSDFFGVPSTSTMMNPGLRLFHSRIR